MKIFIMRHGEAEHFADSDAARQLTQEAESNQKRLLEPVKNRGLRNSIKCW